MARRTAPIDASRSDSQHARVPTPPRFSVALFRGINVGAAKRVSMADLKALFESLGCTDVRTLLNSGNVVFAPPTPAAKGPREPAPLVAAIRAALVKRAGFDARVTIVEGKELAAVVAENPLGKVATDPSRLVVTFFADASARKRIAPLANEDFGTDVFALGKHAAFAWCPDGVLTGKLWPAIERALGDGVTSRNWATVTKLASLVAPTG